jgi:asparagine synthase (glutamine-hydrolysing)
VCGIAGVLNLRAEPHPRCESDLQLMNRLLRHRGPDGSGSWVHESKVVGFSHNRLSIIDRDTGQQPMRAPSGNVVVHNGEIYNYLELRDELGRDCFRTHSDTETILLAYERWGEQCVEHLRGMFAFALWDETRRVLFCARDRFGIKPFHYAVVGDSFYFASEAKALLPFLPEVTTDPEALKDYLTFQFSLGEKTLFEGIKTLEPGHRLTLMRGGKVRPQRYWDVRYELDHAQSAAQFERATRELLEDSVRLHLRSDVPVGAYVSGGLDSSVIAALAQERLGGDGLVGFTAGFPEPSGYDERPHARTLATERGFELLELALGPRDFLDSIRQVLYHLDFPLAGPGSFPQFHVSRLAARHRKVVLGGQGGDEIFGGYARYLIGYFEQCIKGAIEGTMNSGNFIVTYASIIPNLESLKPYKPLLRQFFSEGLFDDIEHRYFRLIDRSPEWRHDVDKGALGDYSPFETFRGIFTSPNVRKESYFDLMTHFDFKTLLPALLHVEDRMSMAHGLEARVPFLDHKLVEKIATAPSNVKFENGELKRLLKRACGDLVPRSILQRKDKMGFPVPFAEWLRGPLRDFAVDVFQLGRRKCRPFLRYDKVLEGLETTRPFDRRTWGLLCLELWQQEFHDQAARLRSARDAATISAT